MQGRKSSRSRQLTTLVTRQAPSAPPTCPQPFQHMWSACQQIRKDSYDALLDANANSYFSSLSVIQHCRRLHKIHNSQNRSMSNLQITKNLAKKKIQIKKDFGNLPEGKCLLRNENYKISPYTESLKPSSKFKLEGLRKHYMSKVLEQREQQQLVNGGKEGKKPASPEIRVVHTLQPLCELSFIKKCDQVQYRQDKKELAVFFRPRNSQSLNA